MGINNKIRVVMAEKKIDNIAELMELTGLSRNAVAKLWHDKDIESIKLGTLFKICDGLNKDLSDIIEYTPDKGA